MAEIVSENNDLGSINWVNGLSDPGEMIACGYLPQLRRVDGEQDKEYAERIRPLVMALPAEDRGKIMGAALKRASLDATGGKVAVMVAGEPPWHGLGVNVAGAVNSAEAIVLAGLDWPVELWASQAIRFEGGKVIETADAAEARHVVRILPDGKGRVLGTVGTRYEPFQNSEAFDFMDAVVGEKLAVFHTAGAINGGKTVWMQAKLPKTYYADPGMTDETTPFILICNSHDGSSAVSIMPTTLRAVCQNTLRLSMNGGGKAFNMRHTKSLKGKVEDAKKALGLVTKRLDKYGEQMQVLNAAPVTDREVSEFYEQFYPTRVRPKAVRAEELLKDTGSLLDSILAGSSQKAAVVETLLEGHYAESERTASRNRNILQDILENHGRDPAEGTAWGMFNALTQYVDHQASYRGKDDEARDNARLSSVWFGGGAEVKQEALEAALAVASSKA